VKSGSAPRFSAREISLIRQEASAAAYLSFRPRHGGWAVCADATPALAEIVAQVRKKTTARMIRTLRPPVLSFDALISPPLLLLPLGLAKLKMTLRGND